MSCRAGSPQPSILAACQCTLAAALLLGFTAALRAVQQARSTEGAASAEPDELEALRSASDEQQIGSNSEARSGAGWREGGGAPFRGIRAALNAQTWDVRLAGAELGLWAFLANACTVVRGQPLAELTRLHCCVLYLYTTLKPAAC